MPGSTLTQVIRQLLVRFCEFSPLGTAFGGFAALLPQYKHLVEEMKLADSLTLDGERICETRERKVLNLSSNST